MFEMKGATYFQKIHAIEKYSFGFTLQFAFFVICAFINLFLKFSCDVLA
jgi:hypothetical protein